MKLESRSSYMTVFAVCAIESVIGGLVAGWLYNYYHKPLWLIVAAIEGAFAVVCGVYFCAMLIRLWQDKQHDRA